MRILFLSTLLPFPLNNGGKIKTYYTLKSISKKNVVDFVSFINHDSEKEYQKEVEKITNSVYALKKNVIRGSSKLHFLKSYFYSLFKKYPYVIDKFWSEELKNKLIEMQELYNYDLIYIDHLPMMIYSDIFKAPIVLDQHNVESQIMNRYTRNEKNVFKKIAAMIEYKKLIAFEKKMLLVASKIITLSNSDKEEFEKMEMKSTNKLSVIPICIEQDYRKETLIDNSKNKIKLLFMGTMSWFPNYQGIMWFIKNVFLKLDTTKFELYVVGGNPPKDLLLYNRIENINVTGFVEDMNHYVDLCDLSIVPLFIGSGLRVKIIEAFSKGLPNISTSLGAEGIETLPNKNILIADNEQEFISILEEIQNKPLILREISQNGIKTYEEHYSLIVLEEKINNVIESVVLP